MQISIIYPLISALFNLSALARPLFFYWFRKLYKIFPMYQFFLMKKLMNSIKRRSFRDFLSFLRLEGEIMYRMRGSNLGKWWELRAKLKPIGEWSKVNRIDPGERVPQHVDQTLIDDTEYRAWFSSRLTVIIIIQK